MGIPEPRMKPAVRKAVSGAVGGLWVDLLVGVDDGLAPLRLPDPVPEIADQLVKCSDLRLGGQVTVEVADQTNAERNVIEVVARDMSTVELSRPPVTDLDGAVSRSVTVTDHEVVGEAILHVADPEVVDVEDPSIPLPCAAVVDNDVFPASPANGSPIDGCPDGGAQVGVTFPRAEEPVPAVARGLLCRDGLQSLCRLDSGFLDRDRCRRIRTPG